MVRRCEEEGGMWSSRRSFFVSSLGGERWRRKGVEGGRRKWKVDGEMVKRLRGGRWKM